MKKNSFVFDTNKCVGCMACVVGCTIENNTTIPLNWREVATLNTINHPNLPVFHLSMACNHCEDAPCMKHCPALAYKRDEQTGAVIHLAEACIGCKYCTWACPFDAPKYNLETKIIEKCNFCIDKIKTGLKPACTTACPVGALDFSVNEEIDYNEFDNVIITKIKPSIKVIPLKNDLDKPQIINIEKQESLVKSLHLFSKPEPKITLKKEWTLVLFTVAVASLVALFSSFATHNNKLPLFVFLIISVVAVILSTFHVGKKLRIWRFILNIKNSWLSREIVGFSLFVFFSSLTIFLVNDNIDFEHSYFIIYVLKILSIALGIFTLVAVDKVYKFLIRNDNLRVHSASILLTSILIYTWLIGSLHLIIIASIIKISLYIIRKINLKNSEETVNLISILRILFLTIPLILFIIYPQISSIVLISLIFIGEVIDRSEFYIESDVITPKKNLINSFMNKFDNN